MLSGLQKVKTLKELRSLRISKNGLQGLSLVKALKRVHELRLQLQMSGKEDVQGNDITQSIISNSKIDKEAYQTADKPTIARRQTF